MTLWPIDDGRQRAVNFPNTGTRCSSDLTFTLDISHSARTSVTSEGYAVLCLHYMDDVHGVVATNNMLQSG